MITIRHYQPGKIVTLYHYKKNKRFRGTLLINSVSASPFLTTNVLDRLAKGFLGLATVSLLIVFLPPIYSEVSYQLSKIHFKKPQVIPALAEIPVSDEFFLEIPKINLVSTIIPNVDSANESIYLEKLTQGVAHAKDSYFPGDSGPIVLFSHSTDTLARIVQYNAKFYALKDLKIEDKIIIRFKGTIYTYRVTEKKIINPQELDTIRQTSAKLILSTCWPPGTDWQRIVVFADLSSSNLGV